MSFFEEGTTRYVFVLKKVVVKIPSFCSWWLFLTGLKSNLQERKFWREMKHPMLARVIASCPLGFWLVMERADSTLSRDITIEEYANLAIFFDMCEDSGLPVDRRRENVGMFGGKMKLIDYGG